MADPNAVTAVQAQIPDDAASFGIDDVMIGSLLDSGLSNVKTILACWRAIAGKTAMLTDVNESGSSRNLTVLNANAREMITYWQTQADREDAAAGTNQVSRFHSYKTTRV